MPAPIGNRPGGVSPAASPTSPASPAAPETPPPPAAGWAPRSNNEILVVGMNEGAHHEADRLKARGQNVTLVSDGKTSDAITTRDARGVTRTHDLSTREGATSFALTLGLPAEQTTRVADAIHGAGADARDELAQLAQVWARAERGGQVPSRLVLSGHSVGSGVWGDDNGMIRFEQLARLAEAMPRAARSVEDLHLSACYSGGQPVMERYRAMFPAVKTIWAYTGSAPGAHSGATTHQARWEAATRGTRDDLDRAIAAGTRKGENVAVWSAKHGYLDGNPPAPLAEVREAARAQEPTFARFASGEEAVSDPQTGALRGYYNQLQRLLQHPELPAAERPALEARRDQTIRLLYYSRTVAPRFAETHAAAIREGFQSLGMPVPQLGTMSRADALATIQRFEERLAGVSPRPAAAERLAPLLTSGLKDLDPRTIPEAWV